jgi:hypothetical protein
MPKQQWVLGKFEHLSRLFMRDGWKILQNLAQRQTSFYMQNTPRFGFWVPRVACYPCFPVALADKPPVAHKQVGRKSNPYLAVAFL